MSGTARVLFHYFVSFKPRCVLMKSMAARTISRERSSFVWLSKP